MSTFEGTGIKIHLFGNTKFDLLANAPIHSCDTAMWAREGGWGNIRYWNPQKKGKTKPTASTWRNTSRQTKLKVSLFSTYEYRKEFEEYLWNTFNLEYDDLIGSDRAVNKMLVNTHFFVQMEKIITDIHRKKGFNTDE